MQFSTSNFLSIENILSDVTVNVGDEELKLLTKGWYTRRVKRTIDELGYDTFFLVMPPYDVDMPQSGQIMLPDGCWNIKDMFAYNGDCCTVGSQQTIHPKRNFVGNGRTSDKPVGYTSRNNPMNSDPLFTNSLNCNPHVLFYSVDNSRILLSDSCLLYQKLRIVYNGIMSSLDKSLIIPPFVAEAVIAKVTERAFFALKTKSPQYRQYWSDSLIGLENLMTDARYRLKRLSDSERKSLYEYLSRMNY